MFAYIFYRTYCAYKKHHDTEPRLQALSVISLMQWMNFLTLFPHQWNVKISKAATIFIIIALLVLNHFLYNKHLDQYQQRWDNEPLPKRKLKGWLIIGYIVLSIASFFTVAVVYNSH